MPRHDDNVQDSAPTQKLQWLTPKISLMGAGDAEGKPAQTGFEPTVNNIKEPAFGPS